MTPSRGASFVKILRVLELLPARGTGSSPSDYFFPTFFLVECLLKLHSDL